LFAAEAFRMLGCESSHCGFELANCDHVIVTRLYDALFSSFNEIKIRPIVLGQTSGPLAINFGKVHFPKF
jgi:hypothetical protein